MPTTLYPRAELEENAPADGIAVDVPQLIAVNLPPEPGWGAVVIGKTGRVFQRFPGLHPQPGLWWPADNGRVTLGCTWGDLLTEHAPLLLVQGERREAVTAG